MLVNRTASDVAAARERNLCALILSKQCSNKIIGSTNFTDILIIYAYLTDRRCIDLYGMPVNPLYLSTNAPAALPGAVQLSERALQVLRLQDRGLTRSEIARQLQLSERSVKYQCEQAYHKLGTSNKVEALAAARKLNLLN